MPVPSSIQPAADRRRLWWRLAAALAVLLGAVLGAPAALAHDGSNSFAAVLDKIDPKPPTGMSIQVATTSLGSQFVVDNPSGTELTIMDTSGDPFLRIGPQGVLGNFRSSDWYTSKTAEGQVTIPPDVGPHQPPLWVRVSHDPQWGWFDERLHPASLVPTPQQLQQPNAQFGSWQVPVTFGATPGSLSGHFESRLQQGAFTAAISQGRPTPGVTVQVLPGSAQGILLMNSSPQDVTVLGERGEPFLRIGPHGSEANLHSPTWQAIELSQGEQPTVRADTAADPQWMSVSPQSTYAWVDSRPASTLNPAELKLLAQPTVVQRWTIPLLVNGQRVDVAGATTFIPTGVAAPPSDGGGFAGAFTTPLLVGGAVLLAAAFVLLYLRTRRHTRETG